MPLPFSRAASSVRRGWLPCSLRAGRGRSPLVGLVLLVLLSGGELRAAEGAANHKPSILLLPVVVHSSESPGYLRRGLSDMMMARFQQAGQFDLIEIEDPAMATTELDEAVEAGRSVGADFVLFGSFTRFGEGASLDMHAASTSSDGEEGALREIFVHSGRIGEVIPDLDDLVGKVARFAIEDFSPTAMSAEGPSGGERLAGRAEVEERVRKLEEAVEALQRKQGEPSQ